ncbi:hypothetical protein ACS0TY_033548 [Phlomoides rotata]
MRTLSRKNIENLILLKAIMHRNVLIMTFAFAFYWMHRAKRLRNTNRRWFSLLERIPTQVKNLSDLVDVSDDDCKNMLRMDRLAFSRFCNVLVSDGGLKNSKHVSAKEKVAIFLFILAHHSKNRVAKFQFKRSGQTISKYFHGVLHCVLKLHSTFLWNLNQFLMTVLTHDGVNLRGVSVRWMIRISTFLFRPLIKVDIGIERATVRQRIQEYSVMPLTVLSIFMFLGVHTIFAITVIPIVRGSQQPEDEPPLVETIGTLEYSPERNLWRDNVAQEMFAEWSATV